MRQSRPPIFFMCTMLVAASPESVLAQTNKADIHRQLERMELGTRIEQRCNGRATGATRRDGKLHAPEEVIAYAFADDVVSGSRVRAPGAAIKDGDKWYRLQYQCETSADGFDIISFTYHLGAEIPRPDWRKYHLSP